MRKAKRSLWNFLTVIKRLDKKQYHIFNTARVVVSILSSLVHHPSWFKTKDSGYWEWTTLESTHYLMHLLPLLDIQTCSNRNQHWGPNTTPSSEETNYLLVSNLITRDPFQSGNDNDVSWWELAHIQEMTFPFPPTGTPPVPPSMSLWD